MRVKILEDEAVQARARAVAAAEEWGDHAAQARARAVAAVEEALEQLQNPAAAPAAAAASAEAAAAAAGRPSSGPTRLIAGRCVSPGTLSRL